jgi:hypothetical protein
VDGGDAALVVQPDEDEVAGADLDDVPRLGVKRSHGGVDADDGIEAGGPAFAGRETGDADLAPADRGMVQEALEDGPGISPVGLLMAECDPAVRPRGHGLEPERPEVDADEASVPRDLVRSNVHVMGNSLTPAGHYFKGKACVRRGAPR